MKGAEFGKAIGIDRPANVKDKIRKWQQELDAEAGAESPASSPAVPIAKPAQSPKPSSTPKVKPVDVKTTPKSAHTPAKSIDGPPDTPRSAKKLPVHNKLDDEVQIATAPKKRVVSDSHWRKQNSLPKDGPKQTSPKLTPTAWVRPAIRKADSNENKVATTTPPEPRPKIIPIVKKTREPRTRSQRKRRPSRPTSAGNDSRPTSSGLSSNKGAKSADEGVVSPKSPSPPAEKTELVRIRRRSHTSPRASLSADDVTKSGLVSLRKTETPLLDDPANVITVEYDEPSVVESPRHDAIRERRRRRRSTRQLSDVSREVSPNEPASTGRRRSHGKPSPKLEKEATRSSPEPVAPSTPPQHGSRLEAWLSTTPDPFLDADSNKRRKSKESVSTLELPSQAGNSNVSASTDSKGPSEEVPERSSESRRRRRRRTPPTAEKKLDLDNVPSLATPTEVSDAPTSEKDTELTPKPTLKRRGAKRTQHSPTKDCITSSSTQTPTEKDDEIASSAMSSLTSSAISSSVDSSALEREQTPLRAPFEGPAMRRLFPSTGKKLSTIVSVETEFTSRSENEDSEAMDTITDLRSTTDVPVSEVGSQLETSTIVSRRSTRRRLASHADLISVLSMPKASSRSIVSARSIRTNRSRLATATIGDIMKELASDETKYMRELRTLVDGVIPVLLSCVLSKSDSAVAAGLFSPSASSDPSNVTKPIVDMGVSLERLKTLHRRVPKEDSDAFLSWAQSAQRVYTSYITSWRLGFQDVVVSLASADEDPFKPAKIVNGPDDGAPWDEGLPRNAEGYVVNGDGERVDVAYMLKRPLVRLKYLSKTIKGINHVKPSERAANMSTVFQDLVTFARKRSNDEHARLEDEAAAQIDPTRARDPRSLAPLAGVRIDPSRCVRARDHFDMHLFHSSGQELNCSIEMLLRDDPNGTDGDLLICEVDKTGRWLLLPPIQKSRVSSRNGESKGEIIVMIRGQHGDGTEWSEVMSLMIDDEDAGFDWVQMLGLTPIPPQISELKRDLTVKEMPRPSSSHASSSLVSAATGSTLPQKSRTPSPRQIEVPIGEQANLTSSKRWSYNTPERGSHSRPISPITPPSGEQSQVGRHSPPSPIEQLSLGDQVRTAPSRPRSHTEADLDRTPQSLNDAMRLANNASPTTLKRTRAKRLSRNAPSPTASRPARQIVLDDPQDEPKPPRKQSTRRRTEQSQSSTSALSQSTSKGYTVWLPTSEVEYSDDSDKESDSSVDNDHTPPVKPLVHRRASSVPTLDMPTIPRQRKSSQPTTPVKTEEPAEIPGPSSASPKIDTNVEPIHDGTSEDDAAPPPVPPHRTPSPATPVTLKGSKTPTFTPTLSGLRTKRRSSSPLKHEYEPSTCTESSSESEPEISEDEESISSESSEDELADDVPTPLMPISQPKTFPKVSSPESIYTLPNETITPSQSASNTPYRAVPQGSGKASRAIASIMAWSNEAGQWKSLHPDECSIVVTPGKIQVFEITNAHSKPFLADGDEIIQPEARAPLIAVELTPLVPLRKSTGIDIEIRSPPTSESRIKSGDYIMLRSRNTNECDQLYAMINHSRINNPTYIALQNARGPYGQSSWAEAMDRQNAARSSAGQSNGWFGGTLGRRSSYRKTSTRAASISAATESSVGTMNTALRSALGRFSFAKNGRFNIKSSTLGSRSANSADTGSSGSHSGLSTPTGLDAGRAPGAPAGITNSKCRLYERESLKKWRDMGAARLTIMLPDPAAIASPSGMRQGKGSPGARDPSQEKRILVVGKNGDTLLDVTLSESCFERVARLGIAVSVWEDIIGEDGIAGRAAMTGGVSGARARVFMIQMKNERECAYSFSLLGKMRY